MKDRIKALRKALNLTQQQFGEAIGLARNSITQIEMGLINPGKRTIADIVSVFNVNEQWLLTGEGEMFRPQSYEDEVAQLAAVTLRDAPDSFRARVVHLLVTSTDEELEILDKMLQKMIKAED
jgi:transcriptional regulator with XRE-family HTH domain